MSAPRKPVDRGDSERDPDPFLSQLLKTLPDGVFAVDTDCLVTYWNEQMERLTGYSSADAIGRPCSFIKGDACFSKRCDADVHPQCHLFEDGEVHGSRCTIERADGATVAVLKNGRLMRAPDGRLLGGIETVTDITRLVRLEHEVERLRSACTASTARWGLVGRHPVMAMLYDRIETAGRTDVSVLVQGETGTGKELIAAAIHQASARRDGPFVRVSCAALPEGLLESELFGHVRGAFSGATHERIGRFEAANGGTLFLDEIGDISPAVQVKLLRVLQDHVFEKVGSNERVQSNIRVIAATNKDLASLVRTGEFRADLYYRIAVFPLLAPSLRARFEDIPLLAEYLLTRACTLRGAEVPGFSPAAMKRLMAWPWPGNVRELEHAVEYAIAVANGALIEVEHLPFAASPGPSLHAIPSTDSARRASRPSREAIQAALAQAGGHRDVAAAQLGVSRMTLWRWMKSFDPSEP